MRIYQPSISKPLCLKFLNPSHNMVTVLKNNKPAPTPKHTQVIDLYGGERGIRTPGGFPLNGFQDRMPRWTVNKINDLCGLWRTVWAGNGHNMVTVLLWVIGVTVSNNVTCKNLPHIDTWRIGDGCTETS